MTITRIAPQPGPQEAFLACKADVAFYGGGAGSGKTFAELLDALRFAVKAKNYKAVIFRRTFPEIMNPGGLWYESMQLFPQFGGVPNKSSTSWAFPKTDSWIKFSHMQHEQNVYSWQGSQNAGIYFDELTHFTITQFFYMLSRNRSICGVRPYVRGTMNPDPDSWVKELIAWWLDDDGYPIPERAGVIRYFSRNKGAIIWADTKAELEVQGVKAKSFTFIPALLSDNKILMEKDPDYQANLMALPSHERERLLKGNWNARAVAGSYFRREWYPMIDRENLPPIEREAWYWDRASTEVNENNQDPDWTAGVHMGFANGRFFVLNVIRFRKTPENVQRTIKNCAEQSPNADICLAQDPGQAGVADIANLTRFLAGFAVRAIPETKAKEVRARPVSAQSEHGNITIVRDRWNEAFFSELEGFPCAKDKGHDDQVDAFSGVFNYLSRGAPRVRVIE